jgi:hypothetical protein
VVEASKRGHASSSSKSGHAKGHFVKFVPCRALEHFQVHLRQREGGAAAGAPGGGRDRSRERERERERGGRRKEGGMEGGVCVCVIVFVCIRNGNSHADFLKPKS